jgi:hypothetical protein
MVPANGLLAHLAVSVSIGSTSSHQTHFNSVLPSALGTGTNLFPQCKQRVTLSIASPPRFFVVLPLPLRLTAGTELSFLHFMFTFDSSKGEGKCRLLSVG